MIFEAVELDYQNDDYVFVLPDAARAKAAAFFKTKRVPKGRPNIGLNTGAGAKFMTKQWPEAHFRDLIRFRKRSSRPISSSSAARGRKPSTPLAKRAPVNVFDTGTDNYLLEFAGFLARMDVVVCSDTLAMHLALALKKKDRRPVRPDLPRRRSTSTAAAASSSPARLRALLQADLPRPGLHESITPGPGLRGRATPASDRCPRPARPLVVVMIPTYNEAENIGDLVRAILALPLSGPISTSWWSTTTRPTGRAPDRRGDGRPIRASTPSSGRSAAAAARAASTASRPPWPWAPTTSSRWTATSPTSRASSPPSSPPPAVRPRPRFAVRPGRQGRQPGISTGGFITLCVRSFIRRALPDRRPRRLVGLSLFRRAVLEAVDLDDLISVGPSIVLEILYKTDLLGFTHRRSADRLHRPDAGQTKLNFLTLLETLLMAVKFKKRYTPRT